MITAYERGWQDAESGFAYGDCPYAKGSGAAIAWRNGWKACHEMRDMLR